MEKECVLLDVFTDRPFAGNQLAVFFNSKGLETEQMQKLAKEINYSETTFISESPSPDADYNIRIFTPRQEMPFAGHPTLGTAYALLNIFDSTVKGSDGVKLRTQVGVIPLEKRGENIWMRQIEPTFYDVLSDKVSAAQMIGLEANDLPDELPIEEVSTGNIFAIIPVKTLSAINRATGHTDRMEQFFSRKNSKAPYLFSLETEYPETSVHTRMFGPHYGITEDAATGSAAGPLVGYLLKHNVFGKHFELINEQGVEMGRPSMIHLKGTQNDDSYTIEIGGTCVLMGHTKFVL
jgi:trans-2,3-dihydro-3-hydroxyanthranilate isomerase